VTAVPNGNGTARWQLIVSVAAILVAVGGALLTLLLNINTLSNQVSALQGDRDRMSIRINAVEAQNSALTISRAETQRDAVEVEEQLCRLSNIVALMHAYDLRSLAILWHHIYGEEFPISNTIYPQVGKCGEAAK
jgi:hypothetical protein